MVSEIFLIVFKSGGGIPKRKKEKKDILMTRLVPKKPRKDAGIYYVGKPM